MTFDRNDMPLKAVTKLYFSFYYKQDWTYELSRWEKIIVSDLQQHNISHPTAHLRPHLLLWAQLRPIALCCVKLR
jgi:hypothetical protein